MDRQQLFRVYVHVPPDAELDDATGLFTPHIIKQRMPTSWGSFTLAQARATPSGSRVQVPTQLAEHNCCSLQAAKNLPTCMLDTGEHAQ